MQLMQENGRGKSDVPMIMGIIEFIATIPGTLCAGCMGGRASLVDDHSSIVNGETGKWYKIKFNDQTGWLGVILLSQNS